MKHPRILEVRKSEKLYERRNKKGEQKWEFSLVLVLLLFW